MKVSVKFVLFSLGILIEGSTILNAATLSSAKQSTISQELIPCPEAAIQAAQAASRVDGVIYQVSCTPSGFSLQAPSQQTSTQQIIAGTNGNHRGTNGNHIRVVAPSDSAVEYGVSNQ